MTIDVLFVFAILVPTLTLFIIVVLIIRQRVIEKYKVKEKAIRSIKGQKQSDYLRSKMWDRMMDRIYTSSK